MNVNKADIYITAVSRAQYPSDGKMEVAFVGRSNVGKSSTINTLTNRKKLARISSEPGKTRVINFFDIENKIYFVDLPGYGFARVSKTEKEKWGKMIEEYLKGRKQLEFIIQLVDLRHKPTKDDIMMYEWIKYFGYKCIVVCTKADKISKKEANENLQIIKSELKFHDNDNIIAFSSMDKRGKEEVWSIIDSELERRQA
jgi:GTP-binding protein